MVWIYVGIYLNFRLIILSSNFDRKIIKRRKVKKNPLSNRTALLHLNPFSRVEKKFATTEQEKRIAKKAELLAKKVEAVSSNYFFAILYSDLQPSV